MPQVLLIEQAPNTELLPHYHASDQFQVFVQGDGTLGKHALRPGAIHYTNSYTRYGPINAGIFAAALTLGAYTPYTAPDPRTGGGQIILVLQGSLVCDGADMGERAAIAVSEDEGAVSFNAGAGGLQALVLQYPKRALQA